ncbi:MAG: hypothetical protein AAFX06_21765 [Planctomycetota bacterium]
MAGPKVVVELTPDEERLLSAFRKIDAEDKKMRAGLQKTGEEIDSHGRKIVDGMVRAGRETNQVTEKALQNLRNHSATGKRVFSALEESMREFGMQGRRSVDDVVESLNELDSTLGGRAKVLLAEFEKADRAEKFENTRKQLESLGGEFGKLGAEIKKATDIPDNRLAAAKKLVDELKQIDPRSADRIADAMDRTRASVEKTRLDHFMSKLAGGNREAKELARVLQVDMKDASLAAEGGIDGIAQSILRLRPELKGTVDKWKADMAEAAKFGEGKYKQALDALRAGGKVGEQVADKIKAELVDAGEIVEQTFEDMLMPLEKIDPKMAEVAKKFKKQLEGIEEQSKTSFTSMRQFAVRQIASIAAAYVGIQEAVQFMSETLREQQEVLKRSSEGHRSLASAQQEALKNLATLDSAQQDDLLQNFVPQVAKDRAFSDLPSLTKAVGDARSAGGSVGQVKQAVDIAAALTALTPEFVDETASALIDSARATGNDDARKNASQIFVVGAESRIVDPVKLVRNLAPVQVAGSVIAGPGRSAQGATEAGAVFAALTRVGADSQGDASQTASIQFLNRMRSFFQGLGKDATEAEQKLANLEKKDPLSPQQRLRLTELRNAKGQKDIIDRNIDVLNEGIAKVQDKLDAGGLDSEMRRKLGIQKRKLGEKLSDVRRSEFTDEDAAALEALERKIGESADAYQAEVESLKATIAASKIKGFKGKLPSTPAEQLKAFQNNQQLADAFLAEKFGEQRFRPGFEQLVRGGDAYQDFQRTLRTQYDNVGNDALLDEQINRMNYATPQLAEARLQRMAETAEAIRLAYDTPAASKGSGRTITAEALAANRTGMGIADRFSEIGIQSGMLLGNINPFASNDTVAEETVHSIFNLRSRLAKFERGGVLDRERGSVNQLNQALNVQLERLRSPAIRRDASVADLESLSRQFDRDVFAVRNQPEVTGDRAVFEEIKQILMMQIELQKQAIKSSEGMRKNTGRGTSGDLAEAARQSNRRRNNRGRGR